MRLFFLSYSILIYIITVIAFIFCQPRYAALLPFALMFWGIARAEDEAKKVEEERWQRGNQVITLE